MVMAALLGWATLATVAAVIAVLRAWHWRRSYTQALELYRSLPRASERTPHQRGAETRRRRELAAKRAHREALERSMMEDAARG